MSENGPVIAEIIKFQWPFFCRRYRYFVRHKKRQRCVWGKDGQARRITFDWLKFLWQVDVIQDQNKVDKFLYPDENITGEIALQRIYPVQ